MCPGGYAANASATKAACHTIANQFDNKIIIMIIKIQTRFAIRQRNVLIIKGQHTCSVACVLDQPVAGEAAGVRPT
jgi:hypothetical protein